LCQAIDELSDKLLFFALGAHLASNDKIVREFVHEKGAFLSHFK